MSDYILKDPTSDQDLTVLWRTAGLGQLETVQADLGWTVTPDEAETGGLSLTVQPFGNTTSVATMSFGHPGHAYQITARVRTSTDDTLEKTVVVRVAEG